MKTVDVLIPKARNFQSSADFSDICGQKSDPIFAEND